MSEISDEFIRRGFWIDWSHGRILGATLTTDAASGNVIIAFLATIITLANGHLWDLILFSIHQYRSARPNGDAVFQQEQAMLRSLPTPASLVADMTKLMWSWRKHGSAKAMRRTSVILLLAMTFFVLTIAASVLSSRVVQLSDVPVLVKNHICVVNLDIHANPPSDRLPKTIRDSYTYANNCYSNDTSSGCNINVRSHIPLSQHTVSCPLPDKSLCIGAETPGLVIDSGLLDINSYLGINTLPKNRVFFRKRTTYVPVKVQDHYSVVNITAENPSLGGPYRPPFPGEQAFTFNYGHRQDLVDPSINPNASTVLSALLSNVTHDYIVHPLVSYFGSDQFSLIPGIDVPDADVVMVFIYSNAVKSYQPIDDPVFSAHRPQYCSAKKGICSYTPAPELGITFYYPDLPAGLIVAIQQYEVCLVDKSGKPADCTGLTGQMAGRVNDLVPSANDAQLTSLNFLVNMTAIYDLGIGLAPYISVLQASKSTYISTQYGLPSNQWTIEAVALESWIWAALQTAVAGHTVDYGGDGSGMILAGTTKDDIQLCSSQKVVKPGGFANVNVFGLFFTVAMSAFLIIADVCLLKFVIFFRRTREAFAPRLDRWIQDGALQLQRHIYEIEGYGPWKRLDNEVPVYVGHAKLPALFSTNRAPSSTYSAVTLNEGFDKQEFRNEITDEPSPGVFQNLIS